MVRVNLEFSGGLELLVSGCKMHQADIEAAATNGKVWRPPCTPLSRYIGAASGSGAPPAGLSSSLPATPLVTLLLTVGAVLLWVRDHLLTERPEMLLKGQGV
eukprot:SM000172S03077  [mRNA]  locus=s172:150191:151174:- [translate_table: standard]